MPILGIWASSFRSAAGPVGAYDALATITLSSTATSVIFTGIPTGYKHLQLRVFSRTARSGVDRDGIFIQANGDTANNYNSHLIYGSGTTAGAYVPGTMPQMQLGIGAGATAPANVFGAAVIDLLDYENVNKFKTFRGFTGVDNNGAGEVSLNSGLWRSTSAVTSIRVFNESGTNFQINTQFALYGIK
jgi:hypothetical protein